MEELEDDPSSEMLAIELYRPAVYAARTFDLLYVLRQASCVCTCTLPFHSPPLQCLIQVLHPPPPQSLCFGLDEFFFVVE